MFGVYILEFSVYILRILAEDQVVYIPKHYTLLSSHTDFAKAYTKANATPELSEKCVVVYFEEFDRLPATLSISNATRRAAKVAADLGRKAK